MPTEMLIKDEHRAPQTRSRATARTESDELRAPARRHQAFVPGQAGRRGIAHKALLACGIVAPLVYLASDVIAGMRWEGYSFRDQTISELNAIGAPTRALTIALGLAGYTFLVAFGGARSLDSMARMARSLASAIPTARTHRIEGAGHAVTFDATTTFVQLIADTITSPDGDSVRSSANHA